MTLFFPVTSSHSKSTNSFFQLHGKATTSLTPAQFQKQWSKRKTIWRNLTELKSKQPSWPKCLSKIRVLQFLTNKPNFSRRLSEAKLWLKGHHRLSRIINKCKNSCGKRAKCRFKYGRQLPNSQTQKIWKPSLRGTQLKINRREWNLSDRKSYRRWQRIAVLKSTSK